MFQLSKLSVMCLYAVAHMVYAQDNHDPLKKDQDLLAHNNHSYAFSTTSLYGANRDIDLKAFNITNYIAPGMYNVSLSINEKALTDTTVKFDHLDASSSAVLCLDPQLLTQLDLKAQVIEKLPQEPCITIKDISPDAYYDFNLQQLSLNLYIPLVDVVQRPAGYISPKLFDEGVTSAFIGYNANLHKNDQQTQNYLNLSGGINFAGWFFRHNGYFESNQSGNLSRYRSSINTLYRDIDALHSRLSLGEFYTNNNISESLSILGAQLASDDNMLPWSVRNYAPIVQGVANTNALVRVFQNGQKIYEKSVPAGAFELTDLATLSNGDLKVEIIENGGEVRVLNFPMQVSINLLKKGRFKYSAAAGRYKLADKITDDMVGQANFSYGLSNNITLSNSVTYADIYKNILISAGMNTALGGISFSGDYSRTNLFDQTKNGQRYQFKYSFFWEPQSINFNANASTQSKRYQTANNALSQANYDKLNQDEYWNFWNNNDLKNQYALSVSKSFQDSRWGSIQASILRNEYWSDNNDHNQYVLNYSNRWKRFSYSLGMSRSQDPYNNLQNNTYYASLSLPLDWRKNNLYLSSNLQRSENTTNSTNANINLSGTLGESNNLNFGVGISQNNDNNQNTTAYNGNINYLHPYVSLGATAFNNGDRSQFSVSAQGALVAHRYGVTATNTIPNTYTIVHVEKGQDAGISNAWGVKLDRFGNAIYSNSSPYSKNLIQIDPDQMPVTMTLQSSQATVIPRQFSATMVKFSAQHSSMYVLRISSPQGQLPMGAEIRNAKQQLVGRLAQSNQAILDQFDPQQDRQLTLLWGNQHQNSCQIQLPTLNTEKSQSFQIIPVECK
ncbi:outer membrane usher protein [Acinetobacter calcoaceticus]|uniref:Outer membrane usher protein n=1 Tax=Acinetobacter calcoaceticus TaxID=471 RepID=A0A4R1XLM1_ACICA|nr:outer membrane usher protein [Acinetobacter calcoaceticus]